MDAVARYCAASQANDMDALVDVLADDASLASPVVGRLVFRGKNDLKVLLTAVHRVLDDLRWTEQVGDGSHRVALGQARVLGLQVTDAMVFEIAEDGRIRTIRPHLRPWLALSVFGALLGTRLAARPGVVVRALRRPS
jgi:hypothetical protein